MGKSSKSHGYHRFTVYGNPNLLIDVPISDTDILMGRSSINGPFSSCVWWHPRRFHAKCGVTSDVKHGFDWKWMNMGYIYIYVCIYIYNIHLKSRVFWSILPSAWNSLQGIASIFKRHHSRKPFNNKRRIKWGEYGFVNHMLSHACMVIRCYKIDM